MCVDCDGVDANLDAPLGVAMPKAKHPARAMAPVPRPLPPIARIPVKPPEPGHLDSVLTDLVAEARSENDPRVMVIVVAFLDEVIAKRPQKEAINSGHTMCRTFPDCDHPGCEALLQVQNAAVTAREEITRLLGVSLERFAPVNTDRERMRPGPRLIGARR